MKRSVIVLAAVLVITWTAQCLMAQPPVGRGSGRPPGAAAAPAIENEPLPKDEAEKRILAVLDNMDKNERRGNMNAPKADGRLLRLLAESTGAKCVVEIGTSTGYSGIWFALALRKTGGKLLTHEYDAGRAAIARANFKKAGVEDLVTLVEGDAHEKVLELKGPIDIVFIDADKAGYPDYLKKLLPLVRPGGLIIGHNVRRPAPDPQYIKAITTNPALETLFLNMQSAGIGVSMKKR